MTYPNNRRTGKTTRLCQAVAQYQQENPDKTVFVTGPHVMRNLNTYVRMIREAGGDPKKVQFVPPYAAEQAVLGYRGRVFVDDFGDSTPKDRRYLRAASRYLDRYS